MTTHGTIQAAVADAKPVSYWLDRPERPSPLPALEADTETDLAIVGGGFTGLWTAVRAKEEDPNLDVVLIEADAISEGASGRNMGALWNDIAGGADHALKEFPHEFQTLEKLGRENTDGLLASLERYDIDAAFDPGDILYVARNRDLAEQMRAHYDKLGGQDVHGEFIDQETLQAEFHSPMFFGATKIIGGRGVLDPARLAWGLRDAAIGLGVRIHERTPMTGLSESSAKVEIRCPHAKVHARRVVLATNGYKSAVGALRRRIAPMWQWTLMTEPLSKDQMESIGWSRRQGMGASDASGGSVDYHWYRLTIDNRIQTGGSTTYYYAGDTRAALGDDLEKHEKHAGILFETFPQLEGIRFTHRWGGVMGMTTSGVSAFGTTPGGRVAWAAGHNGHGINGGRFGAGVALAMHGIGNSDVLQLDLVRKTPQAWPPEPIRYLGIHATLRALDSAEKRGREGLWLRFLKRLDLNVSGGASW